MKKKRKEVILKKVGILLGILILLLSVTRIGIYAVRNISNSQYKERVQNLNVLSEKICNHIKSVVAFNWENIHYIANQLENEEFTTLTEMLEYITRCEDTVKGDAHTKILMINDAGMCYVTDGTTFRWMDSALLNEEDDVMYVSNYQFASKKDIQMHYLSRFSKPIVVDGITFTHASLACDMKELDDFFDVSNYGEESITFIIHKDGSQVYRQDKETKLSGIYNLLSTLDGAEFGYGVTYDKIIRDIESGANDCVFLVLDDAGYYTCYYHLGIKDWIVVLMIPEEYAGTGTREFTKEVIQSVVLLIGSILVVLLIVSGISYFRMEQKRRDINEKLVRAAEAERRANEAKTNFLSSMSHDIRTPMNAITGMVAIASKRVADTEYIKECLKKIELASSHLLTLINDILDISKIESGKMKLNLEKFSLSESFSNLINIMQPQIKEKNQDFYIRVHHVNQEYLYGDKLRLNQIFINLLSNAIKYTEENGKIWVDLYEDPIPGTDNRVQIKYVVRDTGMGMSKEFQESMYQVFSRASDSRTSKIQGSGLGLAICKQMIDLMGGTICCESEIGVGTTFEVTIELALADIESEELSLPEIELLLVDDDEIFLETATETLESFGLKVKTEANGEAALEEVQSRLHTENMYPLIIVDKRLPGMDGIETVRRIRQRIESHIPIIIVSAYDVSMFEEEAREAGADGVITKPFFRSDVYDCINRFVGTGKSVLQKEKQDYNGLENIRLLIAEDNDFNWEIAHTLMQMYGIIADRAENGQECIEMMNRSMEGDYALILMDVRMPVMDGREATKMLRESEKEWIKKIPIVAMTADAFAEDVHACMEAGMNEHIAKPLDVDRLLRIVQKYCS